jgi:phage-related minor tail protein
MQDPFDTSISTTHIADLSRGLADASKVSAQLGKSLTTAFEQIAFKGKGVSDMFQSLALSLSQAALKSAVGGLQEGLAGAFAGLFGSSGGMIPFARGGVLQAGTPIPFAHGGVIASPTAFPLAAGRTGVMGERGAEAIMPLTRGADGRLGVAASGASAASNITVNITASDVESFRRSETQVAALLARAVAHGQRNL